MAQQFDIVGNLLLKVDGAEAGLNKLKSSLSQLKIPANLDNDLKKSFSNLDGLFAKYKSQLKDGFNTKGDVSGFAKTGKLIEAEYDKISATISKLTGKEVSLKIDLTAIQNAEKEVERLVSLKEKLSKDIKGGLGLNDYLKAMQASNVGRRGTKVFDASNMLQTSLGRGDIEKAKADVESLISELNRMSDARKKALEQHTGVAFSQIIQDLKSKVESADQSMNKLSSDIKTTSDNMAKMSTDQFDRAGRVLGSVADDAGKAQSGIKQLNGEAQAAASSILSMSTQLQQLQQSTQYFFSLRNMISLFRRGVNDAIQSVKELDKAMTDTAVVTDYKVSDMWNMLPQYTKIANELGATTQGAYETMTLYFQQGLDQQQAFELGAETMKMARIAGLDYAETTDMMTAALRGFNMELNETSAQRINDVYSKLAAVTASDTEELGTAMQRTASIAHSAGMSFEGTTAFLAQAIETTREPAENIGTAMKTIIARFQELKKNPLEMSEVDGEEVDFNKVDTALKTIGVDLKDTNGQFRDLDKVFLDISERWDGLSQTQQRYIATTAAGSRQQSRFIAMMDNYERTVELVNAANNSAGASNEQFNKTMDSLEAKLNKLHNAWQAFTMGIANNSMIKLAVDGVTTLLTVTNKLIDTLSLGSGALKSFLSIFLAFNGLKATGKAANALVGGLGGMVDPQSSFAAGFRGGAIGKNSAQAINQPIVQELQSIRSLIAQKINETNLGKSSVAGPYNEYNRFKQARTNIAGLNNKNTVQDLTKQLIGVSGRNQNILMRGHAATFQAATNSLINSYDSKHIKAIKSGERFLNDQRKSAQITAEEYYTALQDPGLLKQAMVKAGVQQNNPAYEYINGLDKVITTRAAELQSRAQGKFEGAVAKARAEGRAINERAYQQAQVSYKSDKAQEYFRNQALLEQGMGSGGAKLNISKLGALLDGIGSIGTGISQAGMGIQAFGSILMSSANPALQAFGSALTSIGGLVNGLGMSISGISSTFTAISGSKLITNIAGTGTVFGGLMTAAGALTGGLLLLGGVIAALVIGIKKHNDNIKKAAEEVSTTYKEKNEKAQTNIGNLQSWREDFARLSGGVDENGYNVSLSTEDYDRYLEITRGIAEINPSIVDGYNAQGQAIITNNKALEETLELEKQHQADAFNEYISPESLEKLQKARDLSKQAKVLQQEGTISQWGVETKTKTTVATGEVEFKPQATMRKQAQKIGETLQKGIEEGWAENDLLEDFNIDIGKLAEGDEETLRKFDQFGPKIQQRINDSMDAAGDDIKDHTKNAMLDAFSGYSDAAEELDELITPTYEYLMASTSEYATAIPTEFKKYFNQGLKEIASDANIKDIDEAARNFADTFGDLAKEGGDYYKLLQDVDEAQNEYAATLNIDAYNKFIEGADGARARIEALEQSLADSGMDLTQGYGRAIKEFLDNQLHQIENFTQSGAANLQSALNTMVDEIAAAEGALENFNKIAEGSTYGKAAKNMSQIFETATADEHILGEGDQAFWAAAEAMVGRENLLENGKVTKDSALKQMKEVQEMLKGGQEGWDNFKIKWFDSVETMGGKLVDENGKIIEGITYQENGWIDEIDDNLNPEVYEQIANALDMSKDSLIAMLNLGRQFGEISFTNVAEVRKALATSDSTIKNTDTGTVFVRKEDLESEMTQAGVDLNQQQEIEQDLRDNYNTEFIKAAKDITKSNEQFTDMGINSIDSLVKTFDATGRFNKEEIAEYAKAYADINNLDNWESAFNEAWNQNQANQEFGGIPDSLTTIQSILTSIDGHLADQRLSQGYLDEATANQAKQWLYGGKGEDTAAQQFWQGHGSGKNGEITTSEFNKTSQDLTDFISKGTDYLAKLDAAKQAALDRSDSSEAVKIEAERLAYEQMLERAQTYLEEGTEAYNSQIQTKLDGLKKDSDLINKGFEDLFDNITPESINTDQAQSALNELYEAAINNTPAVLTDGLMTQMKNLGIDIQKAIDAGLVVDENKVYNSGKKAGEKTGKAGVEGEASGISKTDTSPAKESGKKKGKETGEAGVKGNAEGQSSVTPSSSSSMPPAVTKAEDKDSKITVGAEVDEPGLEKAKTLITEIQTLAGQGAKFAITTTGTASLKIAANSAKKLTKNVGDKSVGVSATVTGTDKVEALKTAIKGLSGKTVAVNVNHSGLTAANINSMVSAIRELKDKEITITVKRKGSTSDTGPYTGGYITSEGVLYRAKGGSVPYPKKGTDTIPAYLTPGEYIQNRKAVQYFGVDFMRQINHKNLLGALQSFGSAAKGKNGKLGPNGNGGLTLTGERGFEVAWIPSQGRSVILGANGPQMVDLPSDTVVWDHEQSKKILTRNVVSAGSQGYTKGKDAVDPRGTGTITVVKPTKPKKTPKTSTDKATEKAEKTSKKLYTWWDKMERKVKNAETYSNRLDKKLKKMLSDIRMTMDTMQKANKKYVDTLKSLRDNYKKMEKSAKKTLSAVSKGNKKVKVAGKKTNIGSIIDYDASTQSYTIDRKAINKKYGKKKKGKEAIDDIVAWLDKWQGRLDTGRDKSQEYQDKLDEYQKEVRNAFLGWENELTKVYKITNEIALLEAKIANDEKRASLAQAKIDDFNWILGDKSALKQNLSDLFNAINAQIAKQTANQSNIQSLRTATEEEFAAMNKDISASRLAKINKRGWGNLSKDEERDWIQHQALTNYLNNGQVDYKKLEKDRKDKKINEDQYNLLKQWFDTYQDKQIAIEDAEGKELENKQALYDLEQQRIQAGRDIAEQLYGWKNELTKIWNITQQIANTEGMLGRVKSQNALLESEMSAGLSQFSDAFSNRSMKFFKGELDLSFKSIEQTWKSSQLQREEINNLWDATREKKELAIATKQYEDAKAARDEAVLAQAQAQEAADTVKDATAALGDAQNDLSDANAALQAAKDEKAKDQKALKAAQKKLKKATSKSSKTKLKNKIANLKVEIKADKKDIATEKTNIKNANAIIDSQQALIDSNQELAGQLDAYTEAAGDASSQYYIAQGRLEAAQEEMKIRDLAHEFLSARQQADGTLSLDFDSAAFEARRGVDIDKEQAERITEYVKELTDTVDQLHATYKDITDKLKELYDLLADLKEKMATDSETLLNAYEDHRKSEVSQLRSQFERINSTLKDILDKVKKEIDRRRQREDNEKTEKNISKMQQRLNAMRSNTASGNQTEIMQLQQDIADAQQNYTRSLEDQLISRLQSNADEAYRQRQQQIALLNGLLEVEHATGVSARYIEDLINSENWEVIKALWLEKENYDAATVWRKDVLEAQLNTFLTELSLLPRKIWEAQETIKQAQEFGKLVEELNANGLVSEGTYRGYSAGGGGGEPERTLTLQELHDEGATPLDVYNYVAPDGSMPYRDWYTVFSAEDANISDPEHNRLWDVQEAKEAGQSALNLQKIYEQAGIVEDVATRLAAGAEGLTSYDKEIVSAYSMVDSLLANYSGKEIQITTDAEGRAVISAIGEGLASVENISLGNITKADAAGLQTYLDMVTKNNNQVQGTVNEKGTYIGGNKGSSMVFQSITYNDDGTVEYGEAYTKKWAELTKGNATNNPKEVADAIIYRLKHSVNEESDLQKQFEKLGNAVGDTYLKAGTYQNDDGSYTKVSYDSKGNVSFDYVGTQESRDAFKDYKGNLSSKGTISAKQLEKALDKGDAAGKTTGETLKALINTKGLTAKEVGDAAKKAGMTKKEYQNALIEAGYSKEKAKELTKKSFLKGGIADFTGPAWLDGTPSKPELVLNAKDTKNFIALKDVLSRVMKLQNSGDGSFSNANFEINVNVDHISSDYDVDKLTERIKRNIVKDAGYRNVTQARRMR